MQRWQQHGKNWENKLKKIFTKSCMGYLVKIFFYDSEKQNL